MKTNFDKGILPETDFEDFLDKVTMNLSTLESKLFHYLNGAILNAYNYTQKECIYRSPKYEDLIKRLNKISDTVTHEFAEEFEDLLNYIDTIRIKNNK